MKNIMTNAACSMLHMFDAVMLATIELIFNTQGHYITF